MHLYQKININFQNTHRGWVNFFKEWDWELFCTFSFNDHVDLNAASRAVKQWLRDNRCRFRNIKHAGIIIVSNPHNEIPHVHMLMISDPCYPRRLQDIHKMKLKYAEYSWDKGSCRILKVSDGAGISSYVSKMKNISLWDPDRWEFDYYRSSLLERLRRFP